MEYQNVTLSFEATDPDQLALRWTGAGEVAEAIDAASMATLLGDRPASSSEEIGRRLFDTLFVGRVRELFCTQLGGLSADRGLRLRLALDIGRIGQHRLQELPWESLFYAPWNGFLALDRRFSLVRSLAVPRAVERKDAPTTSLRCLVAGASPRTLAKLDIEGEFERVERALEGQRWIRPDFLGGAGAESIRERLLAERCDILHFAGHGYHDKEAGLVLEDEGRAPIYVAAERLAELIADRPPRLVVLNACSTAKATGCAQPFQGVAHALIRAGLPAVIAMREPILDRAGMEVAKMLYGRLAAGDPLDAAVVEVRKVLRQHLPHDEAWLIPSLFLAGDDSRPLLEQSPAIGNEQRAPDNMLSAEFMVKEVSGRGNEVVFADATNTSKNHNRRVDIRGGLDKLRGHGNRVTGIKL
jgi:hypothetical protein